MFLKPKNIIYLYFEGNDLDELNFEKSNPILMKYLDDKFNQNYLERYSEIKLFLSNVEKETEKMIFEKSKNFVQETKKSNLKIIQAHLKDILEINNLKNIFKYKILNKQHDNYDLELLYKIVERMDRDVKKWNGNYYFVYVPTWSRYFTKYTKYDAKIDLKDEIIKNLNLKNINTLDLTNFFDNSDSIKQYYPLGYLGHYNSKGYNKIADIIKKRLN
tara:strand:- start:219 stop:869 length:651 start_codon:yes stop_codon:yes gene_type:complete